jgi:hypothetical protein
MIFGLVSIKYAEEDVLSSISFRTQKYFLINLHVNKNKRFYLKKNLYFNLIYLKEEI